MRILHVTDTFLPRLGGIELHVADLAERQAAAGHEVLVLTAERSLADPVAPGYAVARLRCGPLGGGAGAGSRSVLASFAPDVVHAHLTVGSPFTWGVLRAAGDVPVLASVHSLLPDLPRTVRAGMRLVGVPTERIRFTAVSEAAAARLRPVLGPGHQVDVLHNGIDAPAWEVERLPSSRFTILSVGRLAARKRPLVLVDALARLARSDPALGWTATIVGDGPQRSRVAEAVAAHGLRDRVELPGALSRGRIRQLLGGADAFVAPARLESFGIAALEARCAGVPVVGMASSGVTEFVEDGRDGLLATHDHELATCLRRLARDPGLADAIRRHQRSTPVRMDWNLVLDEHDAGYAAVLRSAASRAGTSISAGRSLR